MFRFIRLVAEYRRCVIRHRKTRDRELRKKILQLEGVLGQELLTLAEIKNVQQREANYAGYHPVTVRLEGGAN